MKILLINPPSPAGYTANRGFMGGFGMLHFSGEGGTVLPPHQLLLLAGILKGKADVVLIDAVAGKMTAEAVAEEAARLRPDEVFIEVSTPTADSDYRLARKLKETLAVPVILMGPHAVFTAAEALEKSGASAILRGAVPSVVAQMIAKTEGDVFEKGAPGLITRQAGNLRDGGVVKFSADELPLPDWSIAPMEKYFYLYKSELPFATMVSSYGCLFRCKFCPYPVAAGFNYSEMSAPRVYAEMEYLGGLGVRLILFRDALFCANKKRVASLCELLQKNPLGVIWRCETSIDSVDDTLLEAMARAGCRGINFGIESLSSDVADEMDCARKRKDLERTTQIFRKCKKLGIETFAFFVHGLPGDSRATIEKNVAFAISLEPDHVQFTFATPYPGTELYDLAVKEGLLRGEKWEEFTSLTPVMSTRHLSKDEVCQLNQWAYKRFFSRPSRLLRELRDPGRLARKVWTYLKWVKK